MRAGPSIHAGVMAMSVDVEASGSRRGGPTLERAVWRATTFFCIYLNQGLVAGFSLTALSNHYAELGFSAAEVGRHFAIAGVPWTLQPLWGPLVDRVTGFAMGRSRFWVVVAVAGSHLAIASLLIVENPAAAMTAVSLVFLLHSTFASLLDTAADGMIIAHVPAAEFGRTSACSRAGFVTGTAFSSVAFSWSLAAYGFRATVLSLLVLSILVTLPPVIIREGAGDAWLSLRRRVHDPAAHAGASLARFGKRLLAALRRREALALLALCFTVELALNNFQVRFAVNLIQTQGWDPVALSRVQGGLDFASGTLGALAIGLWSDRAGHLPALRGLLGLCALAFLAVSALIGFERSGSAGPVILTLGNVVPSLMYVALVPAVMQASRRAIAATQFALFMATINLGDVVGALAAGIVQSVLDAAQTAFVVAAVFAAWAIALALRPTLLTRAGSQA